MLRYRTIITVSALLFGLTLLAVTLWRMDLPSLARNATQLGVALPVALVPGAIWHLLRTCAWSQSFPPRERPPFKRLWCVRLAAEAFSFVTIRGLAGEPLKVVMLEGDTATATAAVAVALERVSYLGITAVLLGVASSAALATLTLTPAWTNVFRGAAVIAAAAALILLIVVIRSRNLKTIDPTRLLAIVALEALAFAMMVAEVWVVLRIARATHRIVDAAAIETFTRIASAASAVVPANVGVLEASHIAAASAISAGSAAVSLALVRRIRGLLWCIAGFTIYPRVTRRSKQRIGTETHAPLIVLEDSASDVRVSDRLGGLGGFRSTPPPDTRAPTMPA